MKPYYEHGGVTLYLGDCRDVLPQLPERPAACVTDPPYGETSAAWDRWPDGWVKAVGIVLPVDASLWCFGSARMFLEHVGDFAGWTYAQEQLWLKRNGSGPAIQGRLARVHEWAYHWYRGRWSALHHQWDREAVSGADKSARRMASAVRHRRNHAMSVYIDDGTRLRRSVVEAPSVRGERRHQDEKPVAVVGPLVQECAPPRLACPRPVRRQWNDGRGRADARPPCRAGRGRRGHVRDRRPAARAARARARRSGMRRQFRAARPLTTHGFDRAPPAAFDDRLDHTTTKETA